MTRAGVFVCHDLYCCAILDGIMTAELVKTTIRIPKNLLYEVKRIAAENERSFNRQCIFFLVEAVEGDIYDANLRVLRKVIEKYKDHIGDRNLEGD